MGEAGVHPISAVKVIRSTNKHVLYIYICMYVCNNISYGYVFVHVTYMYMYMYIIDYRYIDQIDDSRTELLHLPLCVLVTTAGTGRDSNCANNGGHSSSIELRS